MSHYRDEDPGPLFWWIVILSIIVGIASVISSFFV